MSREDVRDRLGNIDQIRDIIFGAQIRDYENRFSKLESDVALFQQEMRSHVEQIKTNYAIELRAAVEALEKKLKVMSLSTQEEAADLRQQVDRFNRKFDRCVQSLDEALDSQTSSLRGELSQAKSQFQDDVMALRDLLLEELERRFNHLGEAKVSKDDIAETLFALGMRLKGTEFIPQLRDAADDNGNYTSFSLLEGKKLSSLLGRSNSSGERSDF